MPRIHTYATPLQSMPRGSCSLTRITSRNSFRHTLRPLCCSLSLWYWTEFKSITFKWLKCVCQGITSFPVRDYWLKNVILNTRELIFFLIKWEQTIRKVFVMLSSLLDVYSLLLQTESEWDEMNVKRRLSPPKKPLI